MTFPLIYAWRLKALWGPSGSPLYGRSCRLIARGALNNRLVEFEDGEIRVVSGFALRKAARRPAKEGSVAMKGVQTR